MIEKDAFDWTNIPLILGGAAAGLAVYDVIRGQIYPTMSLDDLVGKGKERVESRAWVLANLKKKPLRKPPIIVTSDQDLSRLLQKVKIPPEHKKEFLAIARGIIRHSMNALAVRVGDTDILVLPEKAAKATVEHEIGHLRDLEAGKDPGHGSTISRLAQLVWKPEYHEKVIAPEERAWKYVRGRKDIKSRALGTYHRGFHQRRADLAGKAALGGAAAYGLARLLKRRAT